MVVQLLSFVVIPHKQSRSISRSEGAKGSVDVGSAWPTASCISGRGRMDDVRTEEEHVLGGRLGCARGLVELVEVVSGFIVGDHRWGRREGG
jgi:hypothetical protein